MPLMNTPLDEPSSHSIHPARVCSKCACRRDTDKSVSGTDSLDRPKLMTSSVGRSKRRPLSGPCKTYNVNTSDRLPLGDAPLSHTTRPRQSEVVPTPSSASAEWNTKIATSLHGAHYRTHQRLAYRATTRPRRRVFLIASSL